MLTESQKQAALWSVFSDNVEMQSRLFELLMGSDDPAILEAGQDILAFVRDTDLLKRFVAAYVAERNPDRKAMLAVAMGGAIREPAVQATVEEILGGGDVRLQEHALKFLHAQEVSADMKSRLLPRLRELGLQGVTPDLRIRAVGALLGDVSDEGTRFLLDRMVNDADPALQLKALQVLPINWMSPVPLLDEHLTGLWSVVNDGSRSASIRGWAAESILYASVSLRRPVTPEQRVLLEGLKNKKK